VLVAPQALVPIGTVPLHDAVTVCPAVDGTVNESDDGVDAIAGAAIDPIATSNIARSPSRLNLRITSSC